MLFIKNDEVKQMYISITNKNINIFQNITPFIHKARKVRKGSLHTTFPNTIYFTSYQILEADRTSV